MPSGIPAAEHDSWVVRHPIEGQLLGRLHLDSDSAVDRCEEDSIPELPCVQKFGFFVELMEVFVEGLVPISRLEEDTGAHCLYRERDHSIVSGRPGRGRVWKLGDRLRVRADRIDPMRRRVEFALVD